MTVLAQQPAMTPPHEAPHAVRWMRQNLFGNAMSTVMTLLILLLAINVLPAMWHWFIGGAVFTSDLVACKALEHSAACWGVITEKYRLILFGRYIYDEQWRPLIATIILTLMLVLSCRRSFWRWWIVPMWMITLAIFFVLMMGGVFGLAVVESTNWGGLPLTIMLSTFGIGLSFPLAILLALGRRSTYPIIRSLSVVYIEVVRGIPLVAVLFLASFMFPMFMPEGTSISALLRVQIGIMLFSAAYLAEVIRGGLQSLPKGQLEAAQAMGLSYWKTMRLIILPQALRVVVPPLVNSFIATFKDTSLVTIVGLFELTGALKLAYGDPLWRKYYIEGYVFISIVYFISCYAMSRYSQYLEKDLNKGVHR